MKEIPILFSTAMVQSILEGRKSQTRRLVKDKHVLYSLDVNKVIPEYFKDGDGGWCPYGKPGDILWVRETWSPDMAGDGENGYVEYIKYAADGTRLPINWVKDYDRFNNRPGIHMNKEYARIWLQVESVRVERLQDISGEDAFAEGVGEKHRSGAKSMTTAGIDYRHWEAGQKIMFKNLWAEINGADSWQANPWTWVISFKVLSTTGKPDLNNLQKQ